MADKTIFPNVSPVALRGPRRTASSGGVLWRTPLETSRLEQRRVKGRPRRVGEMGQVRARVAWQNSTKLAVQGDFWPRCSAMHWDTPDRSMGKKSGTEASIITSATKRRIDYTVLLDNSINRIKSNSQDAPDI